MFFSKFRRRCAGDLAIRSGQIPIHGNFGSDYPAITGSRLWLNRFSNVFSDVAGTTPATITGTIGSWRAVGGSWGSDLLTQATGSLQPTLQSDGIKTDGVDDYLDSNIALAGDFTLYFVCSRTLTNQNICLASYNSDKGFFVANNNSSVYAATDTVTWYAKTGLVGFTAARILRFRVSGTTLYWKWGGSAELSQAAVTVPAVTITKILLANGGSVSDANSRLMQVVLVNTSLAYGGADDLAIRAKLAALEPGVIDV